MKLRGSYAPGDDMSTPWSPGCPKCWASKGCESYVRGVEEAIVRRRFLARDNAEDKKMTDTNAGVELSKKDVEVNEEARKEAVERKARATRAREEELEKAREALLEQLTKETREYVKVMAVIEHRAQNEEERKEWREKIKQIVNDKMDIQREVEEERHERAKMLNEEEARKATQRARELQLQDMEEKLRGAREALEKENNEERRKKMEKELNLAAKKFEQFKMDFLEWQESNEMAREEAVEKAFAKYERDKKAWEEKKKKWQELIQKARQEQMERGGAVPEPTEPEVMRNQSKEAEEVPVPPWMPENEAKAPAEDESKEEQKAREEQRKKDESDRTGWIARVVMLVGVAAVAAFAGCFLYKDPTFCRIGFWIGETLSEPDAKRDD